MEKAATIELDTQSVVAEVPPLLFGGFAEHLGRCIYEGIYDAKSAQADERGFRRDVLAALREMKLSILRWPGGNFVSGYRWRDGVGPKEKRPRRRELAWQSLESNQFGTNEFVDYCRALGAEPMMAVNLGTAGIGDAGDLIEYCNAPAGTALADERIAHGWKQPHNIRYWCLGNEMDGPWQMGALPAEEYARKAREATKIMKWHDPSIKTIACGSSGPGMPTFPSWDRTVLEICWDQIDYLSLHEYATNWENDTPSFLAYAASFERQLATLKTTIAEVKQKRSSKKDIHLSWDEWNVWYKDRGGNGKWTESPHLCEEVYNLEDALVVAQWMNVFLRNCDALKIACIAQVVNVIAPLLTSEDKLLKQATYWPFVMMANLASGFSLRPKVTAPLYATRRFGEAPLIDVGATWDAERRRAGLFIVNRSHDEVLPVTVKFAGQAPRRAIGGRQLRGSDPKAANSFERPDVVTPRDLPAQEIKGGEFVARVGPLSFTALAMEL